MALLVSSRTLETYLARISSKSGATVKLTQTSLAKFEAFCTRRYSSTIEQIIGELLAMEPGASRQRAICTGPG